MRQPLVEARPSRSTYRSDLYLWAAWIFSSAGQVNSIQIADFKLKDQITMSGRWSVEQISGGKVIFLWSKSINNCQSFAPWRKCWAWHFSFVEGLDWPDLTNDEEIDGHVNYCEYQYAPPILVSLFEGQNHVSMSIFVNKSDNPQRICDVWQFFWCLQSGHFDFSVIFIKWSNQGEGSVLMDAFKRKAIILFPGP